MSEVSTAELSTVEVLRRVRDRIATPDRWTKGCLRGLGDPDTCRVCLVGAVKWVLYGNPVHFDADPLERAVWDLLAQVAGKPPTWFNDDPSTSHADVVALVDRAIQLAEVNQ